MPRCSLPVFAFFVFAAALPIHAMESTPAVPDDVDKKAQLFPLEEVHLLPGYLKDKQDLNTTYLLSLDPDRFLVNFRVPSGLPKTANAYGGWESATGFCRGHFTGHYLSACAESYAVTGDARLKAKCDQLVTGLAECQKAFGNGYLCTVRPIFFDHFLHGTPLPKGEPTIRVPFYVVHKILAGLLDCWRYTGNQQALSVASGMGDYFGNQLRQCTAAQIERLFHTDHPYPSNEFGGMAEAMENLYAATGKKEYEETARIFERDWFLGPLEKGQDDLTGLHANCHVPQVLGAARDYELSDDADLRKAAENFWSLVIQTRVYPNGGSSGVNPLKPKSTPWGEHWGPPGELAEAMGPRMAESCVANNLLKLTTRLFTWQPSPAYASYCERTWYNTVLGTQSSKGPGRYLYSLPLIAGSQKKFGTPESDFWCCYGTGVEAFARLAEPIYYHSDKAMWVALYAASEVDWKEKGIQVVQTTSFPASDSSRLVFHAAKPVELGVNFFIPEWVEGAAMVKVNGKTLAATPTPGSFYAIDRNWTEGDTVEITLPMGFHTEALPGPSGLTSVFYGPLLLAGRTGKALGFTGTPDQLKQAFKTVPGQPLTFEMDSPAGNVTFKPLNEFLEEPYTVFFDLKPS